ncbi:hypothetical protein ACFQL0_12675 [Haloplanus litoreus]
MSGTTAGAVVAGGGDDRDTDPIRSEPVRYSERRPLRTDGSVSD